MGSESDFLPSTSVPRHQADHLFWTNYRALWQWYKSGRAALWQAALLVGVAGKPGAEKYVLEHEAGLSPSSSEIPPILVY